MAKKMSIKEKRALEEAQRKARFQEQNRQREAEIEKEKAEKINENKFTDDAISDENKLAEYREQCFKYMYD